MKIGFFNDIVGDSTTLEDYTKNFDLIIKGTGSLIHITKLLSFINGETYFDAEYSKYPSAKTLDEALKQVI